MRIPKSLLELYLRQDMVLRITSKRLREALADEYDQFKEALTTTGLFARLRDVSRKLRKAKELSEPLEQVGECLRILKQLREKRRMNRAQWINIFTRMVKIYLYPDWEPGEREQYDWRCVAVAEWDDYFFSYTSREAGSINSRFWAILAPPGVEAPKPTESEANNLVAQRGHERLDRNNLSGFFARHDLKIGDDFNQKMLARCEAAYAFVQLIELSSFDGSDTNWCFREYTRFIKTQGARERCIFIVAAKDLKSVTPAILPPPFADWHAHIAKEIHANMPEGMSFSRFQGMMDGIARLIAQTTREAIEDAVIVPERKL